MRKLEPEWEYIGGYTGSDGSLVVRHKCCGFTARKSAVTVRQGGQLKCFLCEQREAEAKKKKKEVEAEVKKFSSKVKKYKLVQMKTCEVCGGLFFSSTRKYCSDECSKKVLNGRYNAKKRIRNKNALTEESKTINVKRLYERDNGICWICGGRCDIGADSNANEYPSIDHVVPVSMGGKDEWSNIKLAHRICNSRRGTKSIDGDIYIPPSHFMR